MKTGVLKRGGGECLELPVAADAERKNFNFRVVSICMCSQPFFFLFVPNPKVTVSSGSRICFDTNLVTFLEQACVEETRRGRWRVLPRGELLTAEVVGAFWRWGGRQHESQESCFVPAGFHFTV